MTGPLLASQMPSSGFSQAVSRNVKKYTQHPPGVFVNFDLIAMGDIEGVQDLAIDIELKLLMGGIADADGFAALVARQM